MKVSPWIWTRELPADCALVGEGFLPYCTTHPAFYPHLGETERSARRHPSRVSLPTVAPACFCAFFSRMAVSVPSTPRQKPDLAISCSCADSCLHAASPRSTLMPFARELGVGCSCPKRVHQLCASTVFDLSVAGLSGAPFAISPDG